MKHALSGTSSASAELPLVTPLIECNAPVLPNGALAGVPDGGAPELPAADRNGVRFTGTGTDS